MQNDDVIATIQTKYNALKDELDERARRLWCASEANALCRGGVKKVSQATGMAESTIRIGRRELTSAPFDPKRNQAQTIPVLTPRRIRHPGGGRKPLTSKDERLLKALDELVEPTARGDPTSPLRWTCKSTRKLASELRVQGFSISHTKVGHLLKKLGYSLQSTRKRYEGNSHPDRNAQFEYIKQQVQAFQSKNQPVISVDTKKKELIGQFANNGREYHPKSTPEEVEAYDFPSLADGKGIPYGVYDMTANNGWVSVGMTHDTAQFAIATIRQWWLHMGTVTYLSAKDLLITADSGGSNGVRSRLWKKELQMLADQTGLQITVCHFPPGTSKWNKIEHRMFCHITKNWRAQPLTSHQVVVNLIANTRTEKGLTIKATLDTSDYPTGIKISDEEIEELCLTRHNFHGDWNYTLQPHNTLLNKR